MSKRTCNVTGSNCWKAAWHKDGTEGSLVNVGDEKLRPAILSMKYLRKFSQNKVDLAQHNLFHKG